MIENIIHSCLEKVKTILFLQEISVTGSITVKEEVIKINSYKSRCATQRIAINKINPPFRVINGKIVNAEHDGTKWIF